ncbi:MAG: hypothetical protein WDN02_13065 [Methylovirgula sp.]|uniref:hypothetical protein n=1 Tax=Methylovirgula sp. TaxID=1978224 RepID=UPI00307623A4
MVREDFALAPTSKASIVATIGLHGSASTWVYNIVRELLLATHGVDAAKACYADRVEDLPSDFGPETPVVIKSHHGSPEFDAFLRAHEATKILSLRDPRDAALSMAQRFRTPLQHTVHWLLRDCRRMAGVLNDADLVLKYEDRFFDQRAAVDKIALCLGVTVDAAKTSKLFDEYRTEAVRAFAACVSDLSPERIDETNASKYDRITHIHNIHVGDAQSGKWRRLPRKTRDDMTKVFSPYLRQFGYTL